MTVTSLDGSFSDYKKISALKNVEDQKSKLNPQRIISNFAT